MDFIFEKCLDGYEFMRSEFPLDAEDADNIGERINSRNYEKKV